VPAGVATRFLDIVAGDHRASRKRAVLAIVIGLALGVPAYFLGHWVGVGVHAATILAGAGLGVLAARRRSRVYESSMRHTWTQWMRFAVVGESVQEIHRKVRGGSGRNLPVLYAAVLLLLFAAEGTLLVVALLQQPDRDFSAVAVPFVAANGLLMGFLAGHAATMASWYRGLSQSVGELLESGEVGLWGVV
jgi:hypothetical protein